MWAEAYARVCREQPAVVAVYESACGSAVALLLRHTVVPLAQERRQWLGETRRAARAVTAGLREAGLPGRVIVLQWRSLPQVAAVLATWACRYSADGERQAQLARVVDRHVTDSRFLAPRPSSPSGAAPGRVSAISRVGGDTGSLPGGSVLLEWYRDMLPCWLTARPLLRRRLILTTHRWLIAQVLGPRPGTLPAPPAAVEATLIPLLLEAIPPGARDAWRLWVRLVVADLQGALARPVARRDEAWAKWLFLIPYGVPVGPEARRRARIGRGGMVRGPWHQHGRVSA